MASSKGVEMREPTAAHCAAEPRQDSILAAGLFPRNGPDASARPWSHEAGGITFGGQSSLPKQPLPSLEDSCHRYLAAVKPLQSAEEHEATQNAVAAFRSGEGPLLQAQLTAYHRTQSNYFENFCYEAFLGDDSSVVLGSNAFCSFPNDTDPSRSTQVTRAAALVKSAVEFSKSIREDRLALDTVRGIPQCMNQYWWLFGVSRIPEDDGGRIRMAADARHVIVLRHGYIYKLQVFEGTSNEVVSELELTENLRAIVDDSARANVDEPALADADDGPLQAVGVLTTGNQKTWSRLRKLLVHASIENGKNFNTIDSSLFALCLDDCSPESDTDVCRNMICGTNIEKKRRQTGSCINRWYDKLAIIVCENGAAGMNFEHTCSDGSVDIKMACDIYKGSLKCREDNTKVNGSKNLANGNSHTSISTPGFERLQWDIPADVKDGLNLAQKDLVERIEMHQLHTLNFTKYGSTFIKSMGFSPDAFFQMTLQAAYVKTYGQIRSGFEPVVTRQFLHGRTDVVRTTTAEAVAFALLYSDENASTAKKVEALRQATSAHVSLSKVCAAGGSHHRHLYVLQQLWKRRRAALEAQGLLPLATSSGHVPEQTIFTDPGYSQLGTTILMGSNVDNPSLKYAGFGPAAADGFTVCYYIRTDHMAMSVTSRNGEAEQFTKAIEDTFEELQGLLLSD